MTWHILKRFCLYQYLCVSAFAKCLRSPHFVHLYYGGFALYLDLVMWCLMQDTTQLNRIPRHKTSLAGKLYGVYSLSSFLRIANFLLAFVVALFFVLLPCQLIIKSNSEVCGLFVFFLKFSIYLDNTGFFLLRE